MNPTSVKLNNKERDLLKQAEEATGLFSRIIRRTGKHPIVQLGTPGDKHYYQGPMPINDADCTHWLAELRRRSNTREASLNGKANGRARKVEKERFRSGPQRPKPENLVPDFRRAKSHAGHTFAEVGEFIEDSRGVKAGYHTLHRLCNDKEQTTLGEVLYDQVKKYIRRFGPDDLANKYGGRWSPDAAPVAAAAPKPEPEPQASEAPQGTSKDDLLDLLVQLREPEMEVLTAITRAMVRAEPLDLRCAMLTRENGNGVAHSEGVHA